MKSLKLFLLAFTLLISASAFAQDAPAPTTGVDANSLTTEVVSKNNDGTLYGKELNADIKTVTLAEILASPDTYNGQEVIVTGAIVDVCQKAGCWITFYEDDTEVRIKTDHNFVLPLDSFNKTATVNGVFAIKEISEKMAKHFNEDAKIKKDVSNIVGPQKVYEIKATGIVLSGTSSGSNDATKVSE